MSWFTDIQDRIADKVSGYFVTQDSIDTAQQVAAAQQAELDRQREAQLISDAEYARLSAQDAANATALQDYQAAHEDIGGAAGELISGTGEVIGHGVDAAGKTIGKTIWNAVPWWLWILAGAVAFFYFGGGAILRKWFKSKTA